MPSCNHIYHFRKNYAYRLPDSKKPSNMEVTYGINPNKPGTEEVCDEGLHRQTQNKSR